MNTVFVSGGTGFIGLNLVHKLVRTQHPVHLLVRFPDVAAGYFPTQLINEGRIRLFTGDITDINSVKKAINGCDQAFHLAALARPWAKSESLFYATNSLGTRNVLEACLELNVQKLVFSSTAGTFGPSNGKPVDETSLRTSSFFTAYESSKYIAECLCYQYMLKGLQTVIVSPTRVFGPGLLSVSNPFTRLIQLFLQNKWKVLPGNGHRIGNYVYIDNVVNGLILAMTRASSGELLLLGGTNVSDIDFFNTVSLISGHTVKMKPTHFSLIMARAFVDEWMANNFSKSPLVTPSWARKYKFDWAVSSDNAARKLNYDPGEFAVGIEKTVNWLKGIPQT